jgi:hypothetical protein
MDKAARENQALRTASEAVKLMALSQGVHCKMELSKNFYVNRCSGKTPAEIANMKKEPAKLQWKRTLTFLRYLQQGIRPPACLKGLPAKEEKDFLQELREAKKQYDLMDKETALDRWFTREILNLHEEDVSTFAEALASFIRAGTLPSPLPPDCDVRGDQMNTDIIRLFGYLARSDTILEYTFNNWDYSDDRQAAFVIHDNLTNNINELSIVLLDKSTLERREDNIISTITLSPAKDNDGNNYIESKLGADEYHNTIFIYTTVPISEVTTTYFVFPGKYLGHEDIRIIHDVFMGKDTLIDIHPWLLYLIQMNPVKYFFTDSMFGGNMSPPPKYQLAYYIVAHYVANKKYPMPEDMISFYSMPFDEKKKIMLSTIKQGTNEAEVEKLVKQGYSWIGQTYPGMGNIRQLLGDSIATLAARRIVKGIVKGLTRRKLVGGARATRKVRFTNL